MKQTFQDSLEALAKVAKWEAEARGADDAAIEKLLRERLRWEGYSEAELEDEAEEILDCYSPDQPQWKSFIDELYFLKRAAIEAICSDAVDVGGQEAAEALQEAWNAVADEEEHRLKVEAAQKEVAVEYLSDAISEAAGREPHYSNKSISRYWEFGNTKLRLSDHELPPTYSPSDIDITVGRLNPDTHYHLPVPYTTDQLLSLDREVRDLVAKLLEREEEDSEEE